MNAIKENISQIKQAVDFCLDQNLVFPALVLIYSTIDSISWITATNKQDSTRVRFTGWLDQWVLPHPEIDCDAIDIYGARCAVIHKQASESNLSKQGRAKEILYAWGNQTTDKLDKANSTKGYDVYSIHLDTFVEIIFNAVDECLNEAKIDSSIHEAIKNTDGLILDHIDPKLVDDFLKKHSN